MYCILTEKNDQKAQFKYAKKKRQIFDFCSSGKKYGSN